MNGRTPSRPAAKAPPLSAKKPLIILAAVVLSLGAYAAQLAYRASKDLVTLNVQNADLAKVVRSIRWQTWEKIVVDKDAKGTVTLDVRKMPLDRVLQLISDQTQTRWTKIYPVYLHKNSLASLDRALRGEIKFTESSYTNFQARGFGMRGGGPGFGGTGLAGPEPSSTNQHDLVSLVLSNKDLTISARALSRVSRAQVVPENGIQPKINLELQDVPFEEALDKITSQAHRSWTRLYAIQANAGGPGGAMMAGRGGAPGAEMQRRRGGNDELLDTLPPEEREKAEQRRQERDALANLTTEQRQQVMSERMNNPEMQQRADQRMSASIRNSTPEQRNENYKRMAQMRKARAAGKAPAR